MTQVARDRAQVQLVAEPFAEPGHHRRAVVARSVEALIDLSMDANPEGREQGGDGERGHRDGTRLRFRARRRRAGDELLHHDDEDREDREEDRAHERVRDRPADDPVDVVQAIARDGDGDGDGRQTEACEPDDPQAIEPLPEQEERDGARDAQTLGRTTPSASASGA